MNRAPPRAYHLVLRAQCATFQPGDCSGPSPASPRGIASSTKSFEDAVKQGMNRACKTLKNLEGT